MSIAARLEHPIFDHRKTIMVAFALLTLAFVAICVRGLRIDASFTKQLPTQHEYMQTYLEHVQEFGGALLQPPSADQLRQVSALRPQFAVPGWSQEFLLLCTQSRRESQLLLLRLHLDLRDIRMS